MRLKVLNTKFMSYSYPYSLIRATNGIRMIAKSRMDAPKMRYIGQALVKQPAPVKGEVFIIKNRCKGCLLCIEYCPQKVLEESKDYNEKGYHYPKLKEDTNKICVNCGFCTLMCPEFAIHTISQEQYNNLKSTKQK